MDTQKLKAVLLAAQYGSLSAAAEHFSYTPSALSHSVDALEQELGIVLLHRTHTGVSWTEEGSQLREKLEAVVQAEQALRTAAGAAAEKRQQLLRIGTYTSISVNLLPELLNDFKARYPAVGITIRVENDFSGALDAGMVDVVFGVEDPAQAWVPLFADPFVAVVPKAAFPGRKSICHEELTAWPFIVTENSAVQRILDLSRFPELVQLNSDDDMAAVSLVRAGMGVTVLPSLVLKKHPAGIRILRLETPLYRTLGLSFSKSLAADTAARRFIAYMQDAYEKTPHKQ